METFLCFDNRSMAAKAASDRTGPPIMKSALFSKMSFSTTRRASLTGTPGSRSRVSMTAISNGRFTPPTLTPPLALISSIANLIPLSASQPYTKAVERGAPMIIGLAAYAPWPGKAVITAMARSAKYSNTLLFMIFLLLLTSQANGISVYLWPLNVDHP